MRDSCKSWIVRVIKLCKGAYPGLYEGFKWLYRALQAFAETLCGHFK